MRTVTTVGGPKLVLSWVGLWLLAVLVCVPVGCLVLFLMARECLRESSLPNRCRRLWLRGRLVFLRRRERREENDAVRKVPVRPVGCLRSGWPERISLPVTTTADRTIFRDVALT